MIFGAFTMDEQLMETGMMMMERVVLAWISWWKQKSVLVPFRSQQVVWMPSRAFQRGGKQVPSNKESDFKEAMNSLRHVPALISWRLFKRCRVRFAVYGFGMLSVDCGVSGRRIDWMRSRRGVCWILFGTNPLEISFVSICFGLLGTALKLWAARFDCTHYYVAMRGRSLARISLAWSAHLPRMMCQAGWLFSMSACGRRLQCRKWMRRARLGHVFLLHCLDLLYRMRVPRCRLPGYDGCRRSLRRPHTHVFRRGGWDEHFIVSMAVKSYKIPVWRHPLFAPLPKWIDDDECSLCISWTPTGVQHDEQGGMAVPPGSQNFPSCMESGSGLAIIWCCRSVISSHFRARRDFDSVEMVEAAVMAHGSHQGYCDALSFFTRIHSKVDFDTSYYIRHLRAHSLLYYNLLA
jgi:hypothetical protein